MSATGSTPAGFPDVSQPIATPGTLFVTRPWRQLFLLLWNRTGAALGSQIVPPGTVADFAGPLANLPPGWLACGQSVSRTVYANLFNAIGTTWGVGDGFSTFDLPPQNIFTKGQGTDNVGDTGGADNVVLDITQLPAHNHPIVDPGHTHSINDPGHVHASVVADAINTTGAATGATQAGNTSSATTGITVNPATTGVTTGNVGTGGQIPILPPYGVFLKIIKT